MCGKMKFLAGKKSWQKYSLLEQKILEKNAACNFFLPALLKVNLFCSSVKPSCKTFLNSVLLIEDKETLVEIFSNKVDMSGPQRAARPLSRHFTESAKIAELYRTDGGRSKGHYYRKLSKWSVKLYPK